MLDAIGVNAIDDLFDEVPGDLLSSALAQVPPGISEMQLARVMTERALHDGRCVNFIGGGVYEHHIPAVVWELTTRGEFYTAYTPYQAEASQGTLQLLYEYQTMMASLTAMDVSNASLYDGASALAEAVLAAVRVKKKRRKVLLPASVNPVYRQVVSAITRNQDIELLEVPFDDASGLTSAADIAARDDASIAAVVVPQPNYFGVLEDVDALTDATHGIGALTIALVNPTALALLKPPGRWGREGADFAVGEGQPLGIPLASGGPYFGFMCCRREHVRQMPGRIVGRTRDVDGEPGYTLTLQAREQHIRRSKATSNICTNQGLMVTAATIYLALLGPAGLRRVAMQCHANTRRLVQALTNVAGVAQRFPQAYFHEAVLTLDRPAGAVLEALAEAGIVGGLDVGSDYPRLGNAMLVCATEVRTETDIDSYATKLDGLLAGQTPNANAARHSA